MLQVGQYPSVLAVGTGIVSLDILMLSVLSFSSPNSERWLDMEYSSDLMGRKLAGTEPLYSSTGNYNRKPNCKQFDYIFIFVSYQTDRRIDKYTAGSTQCCISLTIHRNF